MILGRGSDTREGPEVLDERDLAIVERLRADGRATHRALAEAAGTTEATARARLKRLEERSVARVIALTDLEALGYPLLALLHMRVDGRTAAETGSEVAELPEAIAVSVATGPYGLIVAIVARDGPHLADLLGKAVPRIRGVADVRCELALDFLRFETPWAVLDDSVASAEPPNAGSMLDELDLRIIERLRENGRTSFRRIAAELDVADATVRSRVARLEAEGMIAFSAVLDAAALGVTANAYVGIQVDDGLVDEVGQGVLACEHVTTLMRTLGDFHFVAVVQAPGRDALMETVTEKIARLAGVRRIETSEIWRLIKHAHALHRSIAG